MHFMFNNTFLSKVKYENHWELFNTPLGNGLVPSVVQNPSHLCDRSMITDGLYCYKRKLLITLYRKSTLNYLKSVRRKLYKNKQIWGF